MERHINILDVSVHHAESEWHKEGVPANVATQAAIFPVLVEAVDLLKLASKTKTPVGDLAALYFGFEKRLGIGWLNKPALSAATQTPWQRAATNSALRVLAANHHRLTAQLASRKAKGKMPDVTQWATQNTAKLERYDALLAEGRAAGVVDLAMLLLANARLNAVSA